MLLFHLLNKNLIKIVLLLIIIHAIFLHPFLKPGMYVTHDGEAQMARFTAYKKAFMDFHIPPRWAGDLNYGYGVPVLNFYYPLPGYIATLLLIFGISHEATLKILFLLAFLASPIGMFLLISRFASKKSAFMAGI
ncbi:MAG: hypothetical protein N3A54_04535, partial [Patescibacteria group bacterium]|nr:hypothetical protein [Patescibacteria group bacterium]